MNSVIKSVKFCYVILFAVWICISSSAWKLILELWILRITCNTILCWWVGLALLEGPEDGGIGEQGGAEEEEEWDHKDY
jgi:hypothetical protein